MAYSGKCACGDISFKFELDPMMHFMCHCTDCQVMFNGSFEGYAISKDELSFFAKLSNKEVSFKTKSIVKFIL